jgi:photosystem II stability/assembly factor-like uncharacterized protein
MGRITVNQIALSTFLTAKRVLGGRGFLTLVVGIFQLVPSGCSNGEEAYIRPVAEAVFVNSNEAWLRTGRGVLKRISTDGQSIDITDAQQGVEGVSFISPSEGWTVDSKWNLWHFDGVNWEVVGKISDKQIGLASHSGLSFVDEKSGWALASELLLLTNDGGRTWNKVPLPTDVWAAVRLYVIDKDMAYLHGEKGDVRRTTDGGHTWKPFEMRTKDSVTAFACRDGGQECWAGTAGGELFAIAGENASPRRLPFPTPKEMTITDICASDAGKLFVSGFTLIRDGNPSPEGVVLTTSDEGVTWKNLDVPQDNRFEQVASFGSTIWLASQTSIYRSSDGGGSWEKVYGANN